MMKRAAIAVGLLSLWPLAALAQEPPKVQIPEPGVPRIMTMEGRYVRAAYNNEGYAILGYDQRACMGRLYFDVPGGRA
jgi:hypothetical protein